MSTVGITAEYNPFHSGHKYHIEKTREQTGSDGVIVLMSGDFVQRGAPAIADKYERAAMALKGGADIVIELPAVFALSSAEGFASGAADIFAASGVVDTISFGAEVKDGEDCRLLEGIASVLADEPNEYRRVLGDHLKEGMSFPLARERAILAYLAGEGACNARTRELISRPNNILAIEYLKAVKRQGYDLSACIIGRKGAGHNENSDKGRYMSAQTIRALLKESSFQSADIFFNLMGKMEYEDLEKVRALGVQRSLIYEDDLSDMLCYALTVFDYETAIAAAGEGSAKADLLRRIKNLREEFADWTSFAMYLKTKNITYTAVNRTLCRILLALPSDTAVFTKAPYIRILGFRKDSARLLSKLFDGASVPVIRSVAEGMKSLESTARICLEADIKAADIYNRAVYSKSGIKIKNDYRHPPVIV